MRKSLLFTALFALAGAAAAKPEIHDGLQVEVRGEGRPVLFIPGLNSAASTWDATCDALIADGVQCHLLQLPGFAGLPALEGQADKPFLSEVRTRVLSYIDAQKLERPAVVGHSLGGALGLMLAIEAPDKVGKLVVVDSLPFFPAATNPGATVAAVKPMADGMRAGMKAQPDESFFQQAKGAAAMGMSRDAAKVELIQQWGQQSAREATTQAMYELFTTDLRPELGKISADTKVLGAWAAYQSMGSTEESTRGIFAAQYASLPGVEIAMAPTAYHFIMFDDPQWLVAEVREHLGE